MFPLDAALLASFPYIHTYIHTYIVDSLNFSDVQTERRVQHTKTKYKIDKTSIMMMTMIETIE